MQNTIKTRALLAALTASLAFLPLACTKTESPTSLTEENIPTKAIVCGHVRFCPTGEDPYTADAGLTVNVYFGQEDADGNVDYAYRTATTDKDGYFEIAIGCPPAGSITVAVSCYGKADDDTVDETGKKISTEAYYYKEISKSVNCGETSYFKMDLTPTAYVGDSGVQK